MSAFVPIRGALLRATLVGSLLQLAMVASGHWVAAVALLFAPLGMAISFVAGSLVTWWAGPVTKGTATAAGAVAGGGCALLGIVVSYILGDVPASILVIGTVSSTVTGLMGALLGRLLVARRAVV